MFNITRGETLGGHRGLIQRVAFSPDGQRFAAGDGDGLLVVRSRTGEVLASTQSPPPDAYRRPSVFDVAWSPDGTTIATHENHILRLRRADDLTLVGEAFDTSFGPIAFASDELLVLAARALSIRNVPKLDEVATVPIDQSLLDEFDVNAVTADPSTGLVVMCDAGGRTSDENDRTIQRASPQVTFIDAKAASVRTVVDDGVRTQDVQFDPWRGWIHATSYEQGTSVWKRDGALVMRWKPYAARALNGYVPFAEHLAISAHYVATMPDMNARTARTIDLWHPAHHWDVGSIELPDGERPYWIAASPDGELLVTPTKPRGHRGEHGLRLWHVSELDM